MLPRLRRSGRPAAGPQPIPHAVWQRREGCDALAEAAAATCVRAQQLVGVGLAHHQLFSQTQHERPAVLVLGLERHPPLAG